MNHKNEHINFDLQKGSGDDFISKTDIPFKKTRDEVWESLSEKLDDKPAVEAKALRLPSMLYIAASFAVLVTTITLYMRFHSLEFTALDEIAVISLPDGSSLELRANSKVIYHPQWWRFSREVKLEGEAYFEVQHGDRFSVVSPQGTTRVLGTTFTVIDRFEQYKVACYSGSVSVQAVDKDVAATIMANEEVVLDENGNYMVRMLPSPKPGGDFTGEAYFMFNAASVVEVFRQLEEYYSIHIEFRDELDFVYSGKLSRNLSIDEIMNAVCRPFGLNYERTSENTYIIGPQ